MKKNRLLIILIVFLLAFSGLIVRLFDLTIVNGETYKTFSDNYRLKEINIDASRGIIYDRNGKEMATNKLIYNLNVYSDRFNRLDKDRKQKILSDLVKILEEDGVNYLDNKILSINEFIYKNEDEYFNDSYLPRQKVLNLIRDNDLLDDIFYRYYKIDENISFYPIKRMRDYLALRGKPMPIEISTEGQVTLKFIENDEYKELISNNEISQSEDPITYIVSQVRDDSSFISYLLGHPISRKIVFDVLKENNLQDNLELSGIIFSSDLDYLENKVILNRADSRVTLNSEAKEDFINLVDSQGLKTLLSNVYEVDNSQVVPASILLTKLERANVNHGLKYEIDEDTNQVEISFIDSTSNSPEAAIDKLIRLAKEKNITKDFILDASILNLSERALFDNGIYPRIYKDKWEYSYLEDKLSMLSQYNEPQDVTAEIYFDDLLKEYEIEGSDDYISYGSLSIISIIDSQGYLGYKPLSIAKNLSEEALIRIEESIDKDSGFEVVFQPNRYYPGGHTGSHILGFLGGISGDQELEHYVDYKKYDINDIVGKTGLEESFEDTLRGSKGSELVYTNVYGQTTDTIEKIEAVPGNNLYTSIDIEYQAQVEDIVKDLLDSIRSGEKYKSFYGDTSIQASPEVSSASAVVMDVKTGEILAMVSMPDYNPNLFVNGISDTDWAKLNNYDPKDSYAPRPILNNVVQSAFIPGSTFKTVTSLAALEKGLDPTDTIDSYGFVRIGNQQFNDLIYTHSGSKWGPINLYRALEVSSNYYYYVLGLGYNPNRENDVDVKVNLEDIESMTSRLGLQSPTGIEINYPRESAGSHPSLEGKRQLLKFQLRNVLDNLLEKYALEGVTVTDIKKQNDKDTIVSWIDKGNSMTFEEVREELIGMGYDPDIILEDSREGLASYIKFSFLNMAVWTDADSMNMVIGQGQNAYTPLQMVQLAGIIANDGKKVKPTLVKDIRNYNNSETLFTNSPVIENTGVDAAFFEHVKEGMRRASATAQYRSNFPFQVGSKTGTAEIGTINPNTGELYGNIVSEIAFAPYNEPEIALYLNVVQGETSENIRTALNDMIYAYYKLVKDNPTYTNNRSN